MRSWNILFSVFVLVLLAISCNGGVKTLTLHPVKTETKSRGDNDNNNFVSCGPLPTPFACGLASRGTGCLLEGISGGQGHDPVAVGFDYFYDPGSQPCPCWQYINCIYRGYVKFDLSELKDKGIVSATLKWDNRPTLQSGTTVGGEGDDCIKSIAIANSDWNKYSIPGDHLQGNPTGVELPVGLTVIQWVNGQRENNGWFFVGESEKLGVKKNKVCIANLSKIRLEVLATDKK